MKYQIHPAAELFPMMNDAELRDLSRDIKANGLVEPITLHSDGSILDGRNRYRACQLADVEPTFTTWNGTGSPVVFVVSLNLHRRHLDESQRGMVAARLATLGEGRPGITASIEAVSQPKAAEMLNVGRATVQRAREVLDSGTPDLVNAVERGEIKVSTAAVIAKQPVEIQQRVTSAQTEERKKIIQEIRSLPTEAEGRKEAIATGNMVPIKGNKFVLPMSKEDEQKLSAQQSLAMGIYGQIEELAALTISPEEMIRLGVRYCLDDLEELTVKAHDWLDRLKEALAKCSSLRN